MYEYVRIYMYILISQPCPKLVAFRGPDVRDSNLRMASEYCSIFKDLGVTAVVRLNEIESYPREEFLKAGKMFMCVRGKNNEFNVDLCVTYASSKNELCSGGIYKGG